ncbi:MAG: phospholipase A [Burkholderiaceae bacterium]
MKAKNGLPPNGSGSAHTAGRVHELKSVVAVVAVGVSLGVSAQPNETDAINQCREIVDATERLRCYDALAASLQKVAPALPAAPAPAPLDRDDPRSALVPDGKIADDRSLLSQRWELEPEDKYGAFKFTYYRPNFLLPVYLADRINRNPQSPTRATTPVAPDYNRPEASFQLSFKLKLAEQVFGTPSDLWLGYTQLSFWQIYNNDVSREFRSTDFEPELMWIWPTHYSIFGLAGRMFGVGVVHQSNGRELPLSRSWNRAYVMAGFEHDRFVLTARVWQRIVEESRQDDNPDISSYVGRAELLASYRWRNESSTALRLRTTFARSPSWGSAQFDYRFPLTEFLQGYVQLFTGYGDTLIDYNFRKTSIGVGISIGNWY